VRRVDAVTGVISTIAGPHCDGQNCFGFPLGLTLAGDALLAAVRGRVLRLDPRLVS